MTECAAASGPLAQMRCVLETGKRLVSPGPRGPGAWEGLHQKPEPHHTDSICTHGRAIRAMSHTVDGL